MCLCFPLNVVEVENYCVVKPLFVNTAGRFARIEEYKPAWTLCRKALCQIRKNWLFAVHFILLYLSEELSVQH